MLNTQKVANYLNGRLDALGELKFDIKAETGKHRDNSKVNGIIKVVGDTSTNRAGFVNITYDYAVELVIPAGVSNDNYIKVQDVVNALIDADNGKTIEIGNGTGTITFSVGRPENFKVDAGVGEDVPLMFHIRIFYTEGGVLGGDKHWLLDGEEIPFVKEQVILQKEAKKSKIKNRKTSQSAVSGQDKVYSFVLQYDANNLVCQKLQKAIIEGDFDTKYYLSYYDDITYTQNNPFRVCVSLLNTGNENNDIEQVGMLSVSFMEADDVEVSKFRAFINLINFPFYDNDDNTLYSTDPNVIAEYMNNHSMGRVAIEAPNIDNLTITSQIVNIGSRSIGDVFRYNYAQIDLEKYDDGGELISKETYYYFITGMTQGANEQVVVDLKMDTIQTYLMATEERPSLQGFIERACLDRFKYTNVDNVVEFDGGVDSKLFEKEDVANPAKRSVKRTKLTTKVDTTSDSLLNAWLEENVIGWQYYYITGTGQTDYEDDQIKIKGYSGGEKTLKDLLIPKNNYNAYDGTRLKGIMAVLVQPVLKSGAIMRTIVQKDGISDYMDFTIYSMNGFAENNNGFSRVYAAKFSTVPPFEKKAYTYGVDYTITLTNPLAPDGGMTILSFDPTIQSVLWLKTKVRTDVGDNYSSYGMFVPSTYYTDEIETYYTEMPYKFTKTNASTNPIGVVLSKFKKKHFYSSSSAGIPYIIHRPSPNEIVGFWVNTVGATATTPDYILANEIGEHTYTQDQLYIKIVIESDEIKVYVRDNSSTASVYSFIELIGQIPYIIGARKNAAFNPKLLSGDYRILKLTNERGDGYEYDMQKLNLHEIELKYTELPTPDISRSYFRVSNTNGIYSKDCANNMTGFVDSADMSLMVDNDKLSQMLAENKNFYLQQGLSTLGGVAGGLITGAISGFGKGGPVGLIAGGVLGGISSAVKTATSLDNMRSSPNSIKNANGNAYFNTSYIKCGPAIEEFDILPSEKEIINDYMVRFGFTYNQMGNLMDFVHKRKYFSYVKGSIDAMSPQGLRCNNMAFADLKTRFSNGVRFWNLENATNEFIPNYEMENYELNLLDYNIILNLPEGVTSSNSATSITPYSTYTTTLSSETKQLYNIKVRVGNTIIVDQTYTTIHQTHDLNIPNVSDDMVITVETKPIYRIIHASEHIQWGSFDEQAIGDLPYSFTVTANDGYILDYVKVYIGGVLVINKTYESGELTDTITIDNVTGTLDLSARAKIIR